MPRELPAIQFYPGDWSKDPGIRCLTLEERGAWIEMLFLMHESAQRGHLILNDQPYPIPLLARALRTTPDNMQEIVENLIATGVASINKETSVIFSRRMIEDERIRKIRTDCGSLGAKYGVNGGRPKTPKKPQSKPQNNPPSVSFSVSVTKAEIQSSVESPCSSGILKESNKPRVGSPVSDGSLPGNRPTTQEARKKQTRHDPIQDLRSVLLEFKALPTFAHIDVQREMDLMAVWKSKPKNRRRVINRSFVANWISKIERPLDGSGPPADDPLLIKIPKGMTFGGEERE